MTILKRTLTGIIVIRTSHGVLSFESPAPTDRPLTRQAHMYETCGVSKSV